MIELRHLRYFLTVADELHFGRAAQRLHISQPPLSRQIQQLEQHIGVTLLQRTKRQVELTAAGTIFVQEIKKLFEQLQQAEDHARQTARGESGQLTIGFISTAIYSVLPRLLKTFSEQYPNIELSLHELTGDAQLQALQQGRIDVGIMMPLEHSKDLIWQPLYQEPLIVALANNHPLAKPNNRQTIAVKKLHAETFIVFPRALAPGLFDKIIGVGERAGFSLKIGQQATQMQTIISLVSANLGVAIVPQCMQTLQRSDVVYRQLTPKSPLIETAMAWRISDSSAALASFVRVCSKITL